MKSGNCSGYDKHACDTFFSVMLETEESIPEIDSHHLLRPTCDRVMKRSPGNLRLQARCGMELCDYIILLSKLSHCNNKWYLNSIK